MQACQDPGVKSAASIVLMNTMNIGMDHKIVSLNKENILRIVENVEFKEMILLYVAWFVS